MEFRKFIPWLLDDIDQRFGLPSQWNCKESLFLGIDNEFHEHRRFKFETRSRGAKVMRSAN